MAMQAGDIISRLMLDMSDFRKAMKSAPGIARKDLDKVNKQMAVTTKQMDKSVKKFVDKSEAHGARFEKGWWKRFGAVALGFTIAYRAMNAFERGLQKLAQTTADAVRESGDLASLQAKLALWTTMHSKGVIEYGDAFRYARGTMLALMEASVTSLSAIEELSTGLDEMGQTLGLIRTETVAAAVDLVDFTVLVAQTTGSVTRQVRQEIQSLLQGQVRTTDIVIRTMRKMGVLTDENIAKLKDQVDVQETFDKVLVAISEHMEEFRRQVLRTDVNKALEFWEKSIRVVLVESILLASVLEDVGNIFAEELVQRAREFREALTPEDIGRNIVVMQRLRDAFALGLDIFERIVISAGYLATALTNLYYEITYVAKALGLLLAVGIVDKAMMMFGATIKTLVLLPLKTLNVLLGRLYVRLLAIPAAAIAAAVALETLGDVYPEMEEKIKEAGEGVVDFLRDKLKIKPDVLHDLRWTFRKIFGMGKEVAEETVDYWSKPLSKFGEQYVKNVEEHITQFMTIIDPLLEKFGEKLKDAITPDIDMLGLMALYYEELERAGLLTIDRVKDRTRDLIEETDKYAEKLDELNAKYRITYTLLAMVRRGELKPEDITRKRKELEIESDRLILLKKLDPELSKLAMQYAKIALAELNANEQLRDAIALEKERAAALKKTLKFREEQALLIYEPVPPKGYKATLDRLRKLRASAYAIIRDMYEDMAKAGGKYIDEYEEAIVRILELERDRVEESLRNVVTANEAKLLADKWYANEKLKLDEAMRQSEIQRYQTMIDQTKGIVDSWTWMYSQLGQKSKRAFEIYKGLQYAQAVIEALSASLKAYSWGWGPWSGPAAPYVATAAMITAWVTAMAKAAKISAQQYQGYAAGGWLDTHPGGGKIGEGSGAKDDVFLGATPGVKHWGMKDEYVFVLNKEQTKKYGAMLEAMNEGLAGGGWINKGYGGVFGLGDPGEVIHSLIGGDIGGALEKTPIVKWLIKIWEELSAPPEIPEIPFDPEVFEGILYSISQMLGETTALDDALRGASAQIASWVKQLEDMNAPLENIEWVRNQEAIILAHLIAEEEKRIRLLNEELVQSFELRRLQVLGMNDYAFAMELRLRQEQELVDAIEEGATEATLALMEEVHALEATAAAAAYLENEISTLASSISDVESDISSWESAISSVQDQILSIMTTMATSPLDAVARLDLLWEAINNFGAITTPEAVSELQGLYSDMLGVAAEAYQRPSIEYQREYADALLGLGNLEDIAENVKSEYQIQLEQLQALLDQLDVLNTIKEDQVFGNLELDQLVSLIQTGFYTEVSESIYGVGQTVYDAFGNVVAQTRNFQHGGISVGPESGYPVMLHGIEQVTPLGGAGGGAQFEMNLTINESRTPHETGRVVTDAVRTFLKSSQGRTLVQETSKGR